MTKIDADFHIHLDALGPCTTGFEFAKRYRSPQTAWRACTHPDFLWWVLDRAFTAVVWPGHTADSFAMMKRTLAVAVVKSTGFPLRLHPVAALFCSEYPKLLNNARRRVFSALEDLLSADVYSVINVATTPSPQLMSCLVNSAINLPDNDVRDISVECAYILTRRYKDPAITPVKHRRLLCDLTRTFFPVPPEPKAA